MRLQHGYVLIFCCLCIFCLCIFAGVARAQQGAATGEPLVIQTTSLPKAYLKQHYEIHLGAHGGITPLRWEMKEGTLPAGIVLGPDGILSGIPTETGEFKFTVTVTEAGGQQPSATSNLCSRWWRRFSRMGAPS